MDRVPESLIKDIYDRFRMFQLDETVLPSWQIRFHSFLLNERDFQHCLLGNTGSHFFYKTEKAYFIFKHSEKQCIAVKNLSDFSEIDIYCDKYNTDEKQHSELFELMRESYRYCALKNQGILLHSSAVSYKNEAIVFFGYSGAGKSTQAEFWKKILNAKVINYDQNYLFIKDNQFFVSSTPWGGKEKYYINRVAPLKAVVMVHKSLGVFEDKVVRLGTADAFSLLYSHNYIFPLEKEIEDDFYNILEKIVTNIPVYILYCSYGEESVQMLYDELFSNNI